jgi:hypothetical protein
MTYQANVRAPMKISLDSALMSIHFCINATINFDNWVLFSTDSCCLYTIVYASKIVGLSQM